MAEPSRPGTGAKPRRSTKHALQNIRTATRLLVRADARTFRLAIALQVVGALSDVHVPQCRNDLQATGKPLCLPINFGRPKVEIRRITAGA